VDAALRVAAESVWEMQVEGREIEIKLPIGGVEEAKRKLLGADFQIAKERVFEENTLYDTAATELRQSSRLLRLRQTGNRYKLTYKGTPEPGKHKSREEIETDIADGQAFDAILARLGYLQVFRYEKFRTEFQRQGSEGTATLDETPIGAYLELEGDPEWIDNTARTLGYEEKDYITASYARLFFEWRHRTGATMDNMLFHTVISGDKGAGD
jgi:adenylate cyclase class 2